SVYFNFPKNKCMKKSKNYVGIDISKLSFDVAVCQKEKYNYYKFSNNTEGFEEFCRLLDKEASVCVMEASGPYYLKLATHLSSQGFKVSVINPLVIRRFCQMRMSRAKTDKKDSFMIAQYGKTEQPVLWKPDSDYVLELKQMQAYLEQLNKNRTGFIRQKEAFKHNSVTSSVVGVSIDSVLEKIDQ